MSLVIASESLFSSLPPPSPPPKQHVKLQLSIIAVSVYAVDLTYDSIQITVSEHLERYIFPILQTRNFRASHTHHKPANKSLASVRLRIHHFLRLTLERPLRVL